MSWCVSLEEEQDSVVRRAPFYNWLLMQSWVRVADLLVLDITEQLDKYFLDMEYYDLFRLSEQLSEHFNCQVKLKSNDRFTVRRRLGNKKTTFIRCPLEEEGVPWTKKIRRWFSFK